MKNENNVMRTQHFTMPPRTPKRPPRRLQKPLQSATYALGQALWVEVRRGDMNKHAWEKQLEESEVTALKSTRIF